MNAVSAIREHIDIVFNALVGIPNDPDSLMHFAIRRGDAWRFKKALARGANPEARDGAGCTALESAVQYKCPEMVKELLARKANHKGGRYTSIGSFFGANLTVPLVDAAMAGSMEMVKLLVEAGADINARGHDGWTALHLAAVNSNRELAGYLLAQGADPNVRDDQGNIPLYYVFQGKCNREVALALLDAKAYVPDESTPVLCTRAKACGWHDIAEAIDHRNVTGV